MFQRSKGVARTRTVDLIRTMIIAVVLVAGSGCAPGASPSGGTERPATDLGPIAWRDCDPARGPADQALIKAGAKCGTYQVPLDYASPASGSIDIAAAFRPASDPSRRLGTLFVETGGPGPSRDGVVVAVTGTEGLGPLPPFLAERYDLVAIDPRFFGASSPRDCGWRADTYLARVAQRAPATMRAFDDSVVAARALARQCASRSDDLRHASTRNIARDIDRLRRHLGIPSISYLGWSYGTYLGAVFAQMFDGTIDRMVLDSALDPTVYGPEVTRHTAPATAAALRNWAGWAARRDTEYHLGTTPERVLGIIDRIRKRAEDRPLVVGGHRISADMLPGLLLTVDDTDESYAVFSGLVRQLAATAGGTRAPGSPMLDAKLELYSLNQPMPDLWLSATVANQCADRPAHREPEWYLGDMAAHDDTEPMFGRLARHITPCAFWPTQPTEPATRISLRKPALLVGAAGDPVAPIDGQRAMRAALPNARMVVLAETFRHGVYPNAGSSCVNSAVEEYLRSGTLPARDRTCQPST